MMRNLNRLISKEGFTLIEVIVGLGLFILIITAVTYWIMLGYTGVRTGVQNEDMNAMLENLRVAFADDDRFCMELLKDVPLDSAQPNGSQIDKISYLNQDSTPVLTALERGQEIPGTSLKIRDMRVKPGVRLDPAVYVANIEFTIEKLGGAGTPDVYRSFPIMAFVAAGKIKSCSASLVRYAMRARLCEINNNGYAHYEWEHEDCVDNPEVVWIDGPDPFTATCPAGMKVAVSPDEPDKRLKVCKTTSPAAYIPPRQYTNGMTKDHFSLALPVLDYALNQCSFAYQVGIDVTPYRGRVKCVPQ